MNAKSDVPMPKTLLFTFGVWAVCVLASLVAAWSVSEAFGFRFSSSTVVVLSSALVGTGCALHWKKKT